MASLIETRKTNGAVWSLAVSPDSSRIGAGVGKTVMIWDMNTGQIALGPLQRHSKNVMSVAFSPDGRTLASGSDDCTICIWDTETGSAVLEPLTGHTHWVRSVIFLRGKNLLVSGSEDKTIRLWNTYTGQPAGQPIHSGSPVNSVAISADGVQIFGGLDDNTIKAYDAATGAIMFQCVGHTRLVRSIALSPDGCRLASGSFDGSVCIWDAETGYAIGGILVGHTKPVTSVAFSPDGRHVASGSRDQTILIWNTETGTVRSGPLRDHTNKVRAVAFTPDGARLISGSIDSTLKVWDVHDLSIQKDIFYRHTSIETQATRSETTSRMAPRQTTIPPSGRRCAKMVHQVHTATGGDHSALSDHLEEILCSCCQLAAQSSRGLSFFAARYNKRTIAVRRNLDYNATITSVQKVFPVLTKISPSRIVLSATFSEFGDVLVEVKEDLWFDVVSKLGVVEISVDEGYVGL